MIEAVTLIGSFRFGPAGLNATPVTVGAKFLTCTVTALGAELTPESTTVSLKTRSPVAAGATNVGLAVSASCRVTAVPEVCCQL